MVDFKEQLCRQILFIQNSCRLYDEGHLEEAIRIAVSLRVLFYDTKNSVSLLQHLKSKSIFLLSTADLARNEQDHNLALVKSLVKVNADLPQIKGTMVPALDDPTRREFVLFETWWRKESIIQLVSHGSLNRRDLILAAVNKDGGAHVDVELQPTYNKTRLGADMEIEISLKTHPNALKTMFENAHYASLRQIGYEVLNSPSITNLSASGSA